MCSQHRKNNDQFIDVFDTVFCLARSSYVPKVTCLGLY
jgi:hypothetical protein